MARMKASAGHPAGFIQAGDQVFGTRNTITANHAFQTLKPVTCFVGIDVFSELLSR